MPDKIIFDRFSERWPQADDRLLPEGRDVFPAEGGSERNYRMLLGYKQAGDLLLEQALDDRSDGANLIFPALFNYRHYIEIALKDAISRYGEYAGVKLETPDHRLASLWQSFSAIATEVGVDCIDDAHIAVGNCVDELDAIDTRSTAFRYASNKDDSVPALPYSGIDLMKIRQTMDGISNYFECAALHFEQCFGPR